MPIPVAARDVNELARRGHDTDTIRMLVSQYNSRTPDQMLLFLLSTDNNNVDMDVKKQLQPQSATRQQRPRAAFILCALPCTIRPRFKTMLRAARPNSC